VAMTWQISLFGLNNMRILAYDFLYENQNMQLFA